MWAICIPIHILCLWDSLAWFDLGVVRSVNAVCSWVTNISKSSCSYIKRKICYKNISKQRLSTEYRSQGVIHCLDLEITQDLMYFCSLHISVWSKLMATDLNQQPPPPKKKITPDIEIHTSQSTPIPQQSPYLTTYPPPHPPQTYTTLLFSVRGNPPSMCMQICVWMYICEVGGVGVSRALGLLF